MSVPLDRTGALRRFVRYGVVGVVGTIVHFGVAIVLVEWLRVDPIAATVVGFACAVVVSYVLNRNWTFGSRVAWGPGLLRYLSVSLLGFALNVAIMATVTRVLLLDYRIGLAIVVLVIPATNFLLNARWTFRDRRS